MRDLLRRRSTCFNGEPSKPLCLSLSFSPLCQESTPEAEPRCHGPRVLTLYVRLPARGGKRPSSRSDTVGKWPRQQQGAGPPHRPPPSTPRMPPLQLMALLRRLTLCPLRVLGVPHSRLIVSFLVDRRQLPSLVIAYGEANPAEASSGLVYSSRAWVLSSCTFWVDSSSVVPISLANLGLISI